MLMEAHEAYRAGNIDTALLKYAMLAELGYEVAQSNVAYILDNGKLVSFNSKQFNATLANNGSCFSTSVKEKIMLSYSVHFSQSSCLGLTTLAFTFCVLYFEIFSISSVFQITLIHNQGVNEEF